MLDFKKLEFSDQEKMTPYLTADGAIMSDRTFASLYIWREQYDVQICCKDEFLYFLSKNHKDLRTYYMPLSVGQGDLARAMAEIEADSAAAGMPYQVVLVTPEGKDALEALCPGKYDFLEDRDNYDYIYRAEDLRTLKGKKFHAKRNYINRFCTMYNGRWRYVPIDPAAHRDMLHAYTIQWGAARQGDGNQDDYESELRAIDAALENYDALHMRGGILLVDEKIAAYTLAAVDMPGVIDVLFEKADTDIEGAYPMINNQFAIHAFDDIELVNREEDLGIPGLRTAKLSYNPIRLTEKYILQPRR